jgi:3-phenylpropionate/cinnamic acid dioxygenase small subunit
MTEPARQVSDPLAIQQLLSRYTYACDTRDWDLLDACFLPDARIQYESLPPFPDGYAGLRGSTVRTLTLLRSTQHLLGNLHVTVDGDRATAASYVQATHVADDGRSWVTGGRYDDELVRTADGWRIAARTFRRQWRSDPDGVAARVMAAATAPSGR